MNLWKFLKHEVDDWDADSNYIYLKLDKEKYYFPVMPTTKSELRLWAILNFAPLGDDFEDLRAELEKNSKELEVYKKALELACKHWSDLEEAVEESGIEIKYHIYSSLPRDRKVEVYLMKARKQSDV